jgi:hypothetical protein
MAALYSFQGEKHTQGVGPSWDTAAPEEDLAPRTVRLAVCPSGPVGRDDPAFPDTGCGHTVQPVAL